MTREQCLKQAEQCVCGKREHDYGKPENNFQKIANLWTAYLSNGYDFTPKDVAVMMCLLKIARIRNSDTEDSFVDLAGYAACGCEIATMNRDVKITDSVVFNSTNGG